MRVLSPSPLLFMYTYVYLFSVFCIHALLRCKCTPLIGLTIARSLYTQETEKCVKRVEAPRFYCRRLFGSYLFILRVLVFIYLRLLPRTGRHTPARRAESRIPVLYPAGTAHAGRRPAPGRAHTLSLCVSQCVSPHSHTSQP